MADSSDKVWRAIGSLADEIRSAMDIVNSDDRLARRLENIAREGSVLYQPTRDDPLLAAGLIRKQAHASPARVEIRAPVIGNLALHG